MKADRENKMLNSKTVYRAFPSEIQHPSRARRSTAEEFRSLEKVKMEQARGVIAGHKQTTIWYVEKERTYIVQIEFDDKLDIYVRSLCTFTPTFGMDKFDGQLAQDIEEFILNEKLGYMSERLKIYDGHDTVRGQEYLRSRGFLPKE